MQLTGGNLVFEAHQYFDGPESLGGGGTYGGTFASYTIDTQTGVQSLIPFTNWLTATGAAGYIGEFGIPNSTADNNAQWFPTQLNFLNAAKTAGLKGTQWFYGNNGIQPGNNLNFMPVAGADDPRLTQMLGVF